MLALCLLLTFFQAITLNDLTLLSTLFIYFWSPSQTKVREWSCQRSRYYHVTPQLALCSEKDGALSGCVVLHYWFIVACQLGLYLFRSPRRQIHDDETSLPPTQDPILQKPRKPPDESPRSFAIFTIYLLAVLTHAAAIANASEPLHHLSALPITLFSFFATATLRSRLRDLYEQRRITTSFFSAPHLFPITSQASFSSTSQFRDVDNSTKFSMLCAWNNSNSRAPVYMDYAPGSKAICIDTGASVCISNDKSDFISLTLTSDQTLQGIGSGLEIAGEGTLRWSINDDDGHAIILHVRNALYVPKVPMCLLCPQQVAHQTSKIGDGFNAGASHGTLAFDGFIRTIPYNTRNNLPIVFTSGKLAALYSPFAHESSSPHTTCDSAYANSLLNSAAALNGTVENLSRTQRLLLLVHQRMAHLNLDRVQRLARGGYFGEALRCIGSCDKPLCSACCTGKASQRPARKDGSPLKAGHLKPGDCVSCDQLQSNTPGRIPVWKGEPSKLSYGAASLFIDHASNKVHVSLHHSTGAAEAVDAKHRFEKMAAENNVSILKYHGDNGVYATHLFKSSCKAQQQTHDYCGVGAHHQNGVAERMIRTIVQRARSMLHHATILWPDIITESLWPFALKLAVDVHNATPGDTDLSPDEIFSGVKSSRCRLKDFHPFGCPVFVLEASLQNGSKIPKWKPRSRMAVYLGHSPEHATTVPIVLNTVTGLISPQYHVVFDDSFTTTKSLHTDKIPENWPELFKHSEFQVLDESEVASHKLSSSWTDPALEPAPARARTTIRFVDELEKNEQEQGTIPSAGDEVVAADPSDDPTRAPNTWSSKGSLLKPAEPLARKTWTKDHRYPTRFKQTMQANVAALDSFLDSEALSLTGLSALLAEQDAVTSNNDGTLNESQHYAFAAASDDTLHYGQMRRDPDRSLFEMDMQREVNDLVASGSVSIVRRETLPAQTKVIAAIWSFRRKRAPDWTVTKWKARLCPHGGQQVEGINFWETYAPVVTWSTVRLILILSLISGMKSRQLDYVQAYTQAPIDCEIYMCVPAQFIVNSHGALEFSEHPAPGNSIHHVILLTKNLYGLRQAGNNWFDKLRGSLASRGFQQSSVDPCLFIRRDLILVVYVDDCLLFAKDDRTLDSFVLSLQEEFVLTCDGDVGAFLGIAIVRNVKGHLELTQPGLIDKIIKECGLEHDSKQHKTPAITTILQKDSDGAQREHTWKYRTLIGMLTYLSMSSRPDIAFAVHQCARFSTCPMRTHELAVRRICRYLQGTKTKGYILEPSMEDRDLNCYVDADFAGLWHEDISDEPVSVKSRTGYVITFANCPVLWVSKLQTEIALSTTEAEYIALSQAMRDLIPMRTLLTELASLTKLEIGKTTTLSTVFEDNKGCIELANAPKMRPRTKHIAIKYHHFRSHVANGDIKIQWIDTKHQLADIFTKPLAEIAFSSLRLALLGW